MTPTRLLTLTLTGALLAMLALPATGAAQEPPHKSCKAWGTEDISFFAREARPFGLALKDFAPLNEFFHAEHAVFCEPR